MNYFEKNINNVREAYIEVEKEKVSIVSDIIGKVVGGHKNIIKD